MTKEWPKEVVDHIDGNPNNNIWSNLRDVNESLNRINQTLRCDNKAGKTGVSKFKSGKYGASIRINGCTYYGGKFDTLDEAVEARIQLEKNHNVITRTVD